MAGRGNLALKIVIGLLVVMFMMQGITKLLGILLVEEFAEWGYPRWFHVLIGVVEVAAGLALLKASTRLYGAVTIIVVMLGAAYTLAVRAGQPAMAVTPVVMLLLASFVAVKSRSTASTAAEL